MHLSVAVPPGYTFRLDSSTSWSATLGAARFAQSSSRPWSDTAHTRLLVVLSRSAAMTGEAFEFARLGLRRMLTRLPPGWSAAIIPTGTIDSPTQPEWVGGTAAVSQLDDLAPPTNGRHNPPPAAIQLPPLGVTETHVVMVLSDADPAPNSANGASSTWILRLTQQSTAPLVSSRDSAAWIIRLPVNPNAISRVLDAVEASLGGRIELLFPMPSLTLSALDRWLDGSVSFGAGRDPFPIRWKPPLFALPTLRRTADTALISDAVRADVLGGGSGWNTELVTFFLGLTAALGWWMAPRVAWWMMPPIPERTGNTTIRTAMPGKAMVEAPARKPEDITHQTARRTAMQR